MRYLKFFFIFFISTLSYAETMNTTLDNGLKVVIKKDPRAPVVTSHLWYKIGSGDEQNGITGISHALEHMMFKGTKNFQAQNFQIKLKNLVEVKMHLQVEITQHIIKQFQNHFLKM